MRASVRVALGTSTGRRAVQHWYSTYRWHIAYVVDIARKFKVCGTTKANSAINTWFPFPVYTVQNDWVGFIVSNIHESMLRFYTRSFGHFHIFQMQSAVMINQRWLLFCFNHWTNYARPSFTVSRLSRRNFSWSNHYSKSLWFFQLARLQWLTVEHVD